MEIVVLNNALHLNILFVSELPNFMPQPETEIHEALFSPIMNIPLTINV